MKIIRKTAIVMLLCLYFLTYGVLPQVQAAGKDAPVIVVAHRAGAKVAPENTVAALEQAIRDGVPIAEIDVQQLSDGTLISKKKNTPRSPTNFRSRSIPSKPISLKLIG